VRHLVALMLLHSTGLGHFHLTSTCRKLFFKQFPDQMLKLYQYSVSIR